MLSQNQATSVATSSSVSRRSESSQQSTPAQYGWQATPQPSRDSQSNANYVESKSKSKASDRHSSFAISNNPHQSGEYNSVATYDSGDKYYTENHYGHYRDHHDLHCHNYGGGVGSNQRQSEPRFIPTVFSSLSDMLQRSGSNSRSSSTDSSQTSGINSRRRQKLKSHLKNEYFSEIDFLLSAQFNKKNIWNFISNKKGFQLL